MTRFYQRGLALIWLVLATVVVITGVEVSLLVKTRQEQSPAFQAAREWQGKASNSSSQVNPADPADPNLQNLCLQNPADPTCFQHYQLYQDLYEQGQFPNDDQFYFQQLEQLYGGGGVQPQPQPQPQANYLNPLNDPNINPLADPRINPLMDPNINPLADPNINPMADPNLNPGCIPCQYGGGEMSGQAFPGGYGRGQWGEGF